MIFAVPIILKGLTKRKAIRHQASREGIVAADCDHYSRPFLYTLAQPIYHLGGRASSTVGPVAVSLYLVNGWNETEDSNAGSPNTRKRCAGLAEGGRYLARGLRENDSLLSLNLRLNRLEDEGCRLLFEGIQDNLTLTDINIGCNGAAAQAAQTIFSVLRDQEHKIRKLDISGNDFDANQFEMMRLSLGANKSLISVDVRNNPGTKDAERAINEIEKIVHNNEINCRKLNNYPMQNFFLNIFLCSIFLFGSVQAQSCSWTDQIKYPDGSVGCLSELPFAKEIVKEVEF
jgi:hypothetical protein